MISNRKSKLALIHLARKQLKLDDDAYRALLHGAAGVDSAADIDTESRFMSVMEAFKNVGFKTESVTRASRDWWGCTGPQKSVILRLWGAVARNPTDQALKAFVARVAHVEAVQWMSPALATKVILALKAMATAKGLDPDKLPDPKVVAS